jgi:hypothetical protein
LPFGLDRTFLPLPPIPSTEQFANTHHRSVVSVLFSLISETFLREHFKIIYFLDPSRAAQLADVLGQCRQYRTTSG